MFETKIVRTTHWIVQIGDNSSHFQIVCPQTFLVLHRTGGASSLCGEWSRSAWERCSDFLTTAYLANHCASGHACQFVAFRKLLKLYSLYVQWQALSLKHTDAFLKKYSMNLALKKDSKSAAEPETCFCYSFLHIWYCLFISETTILMEESLKVCSVISHQILVRWSTPWKVGNGSSNVAEPFCDSNPTNEMHSVW